MLTIRCFTCNLTHHRWACKPSLAKGFSIHTVARERLLSNRSTCMYIRPSSIMTTYDRDDKQNKDFKGHVNLMLKRQIWHRWFSSPLLVRLGGRLPLTANSTEPSIHGMKSALLSKSRPFRQNVPLFFGTAVQYVH